MMPETEKAAPAASRRSRLGRAAFLAAFAALLAAPPLAHLLVGPVAQEDNRAMAQAPERPRDWAQAVAWPRRVDAYLQDNFGFRREMVRANTVFWWSTLGESTSPSIVPGRNGRIFHSFNDTSKREYRELLMQCGALSTPEWLDAAAASLGAALDRLAARLPDAALMLVPTSMTVYPEDYPAWMSAACAGRRPPPLELLDRLDQAQRARIVYPVAQATAQRGDETLIPPHNFHWDGLGASVLIRHVAEEAYGLPRRVTMPFKEGEFASDLAGMIPGLGLSNRVLRPEVWATGVSPCIGAACFKEFHDPGGRYWSMVWRLRREGGDPASRLLVLADSFGPGAGQAFIEHFDDVVILNINDFGQMTREELRALWTQLFQDWRPARTQFVFCDCNVTSIETFVDALPVIEDAPAQGSRPAL